jgi:hypothetical protein
MAALVEHTEAPIRQRRLENPWEGWVAGTVLGEEGEARALIREACLGMDEGERKRASDSIAPVDRGVGVAQLL